MERLHLEGDYFNHESAGKDSGGKGEKIIWPVKWESNAWKVKL